MVQKKWDPSKIEDRLQMRAIERRRPLSCVLELTYHCNFRCKMCYVRMTDEQAAPYGRLRTVDEWLDMARQIYDAGVLYLTLTGGECTLYPGFEKLYEQLYKMGFRLSIMSNAGAYTDRIRDLFRRFPPYNAAITLYGGCSETYEAITGDPYGFDKVLENIWFFQSIGVRISLNFTMIQQNVLDYPKISALCRKLGISYTLITDITGHHRNQTFSEALECRLSPAQRACVACHPPEEVAKALEESKELEKELEHFLAPAVSANILKTHQEQSTLPDNCIGSYSSCAISWDGRMQTCISMNGYSPQKPFDVGFETAWKRLMDEHAEIFHFPETCRICSMSANCTHNCPGRRYEGTGSPFNPDPYACQYTYLLSVFKEKKRLAGMAEEFFCS